MSSYQKCLYSLFAILFFSGLLKAQHLSNQQKEKINSIFNSYKSAPGCAVGIFKKGEIIYSNGYGLSNIGSQEFVSDRTVFDIASVSKQFTAACIFLLEAEGKLSLEDEIQKYLPSIPKYNGQTISVKHLLNHSSGLRSYLKLLFAKGISWDSKFTNKDGLELMAEQRGSNFEPGSKFSYSNTGYMLLASIIEIASGKPYPEYAQEKLFNPLGMTNTYIGQTKRKKEKAIGYTETGEGYQAAHYDNNSVIGDGGVYSNILDFFKWSENFKTGKVGGELLIKKMTTSGYLKNNRPTNYGGGLFLGDYQNIPGLYTIGHSGEWGSFRSLFFKFVEQDIAFVLLSNNANTNVWSLLNQLVGSVMQMEVEEARNSLLTNETKKTKEASAVVIDKKDLSTFLGHYFNPVEGNTRTIGIENDTLVYQRSNGVGTKLIPMEKNSFHFMDMPHVTVKFDMGSQPCSLSLDINGRTSFQFNKYIPLEYDSKEIEQFTGNYYSDELDTTYQIKSKGKQLLALIKDSDTITLNPVMKNIFNEVHFGYLKFETNKKGRINGFTVNDELINNIHFERI
ncbi:serine hydrolase domain-containing protein [Flagellimonas meishanensis]|uniref:serine hydrolase domain-containing protein n=1 Tax=Flagellimonas meishanensis TaxID=2873264 RepID=UPI001CA66703|nr:serine hydrolase domain-containing protein [[Muricauda] meishanensis]